MKPCDHDWSFLANKHLKLQISQNQNRMDIADEEIPRGGNPLAVWAALVMVVVVVFFAVMLVLHFADVIDGRPAANVRLA